MNQGRTAENRKPADPTAFTPADLTDGHKPFEWRSKYRFPKLVRTFTRWEAIYLVSLLLAMPVLMTVLWLQYPRFLLRIPPEQYRPIVKYGFAWAAGTLGGVLFDLKWLYHSVAKGLWHFDRRLWRFLTPHISGGLSFVAIALISSGAMRIFDPKATQSMSLVVGLGFLIGYFSDTAVAKLSEVAETLFGSIRSTGKTSEKKSREISQDHGPQSAKNSASDEPGATQ